MRSHTRIFLPDVWGGRVAAALGLIVPILVIAAAALAGDDPPTRPTSENRLEQVIGITAPVQEATLASVNPARIEQILAAEGAAVRAGDIVVTLDDQVQRARTDIAQAAAESTLATELARAHWQRAKRDLDRLMKLHGGDYASSKELSDAAADAEIMKIEYDLARFELAQAKRTHLSEQAALEEFRLHAPFTGYVFEHLKHDGETVDQLEGILTVVQLDPLLVPVDCPLAFAPHVHAGDKVMVRPVDEHYASRMGTVVLASRVADGASQTFKVKLTVDNADFGWPAGLKVAVEFSGQTRTAGESDSDTPPASDQREPSADGADRVRREKS